MEQELGCAKGMLIGVAVSIPLWAMIVCVALEVYKALVG